MEDFDPLDICSPISDITLVLGWKCDGKCWIHKHITVDISDRTEGSVSGTVLDLRQKGNVFPEYKLQSRLLPKTLFCHDYKGGYLEDRFCNGDPNIDTYRFFNWAGIDIFIYFSHKLVTIPPLGWLNAGHTHGVPVLGTLITEWNDGEKIWKDILSDVDKTNLFSQKLAQICAHFKFDGYLLNVENKIPKDLIPRLVNFVALLKSHLDLYCERQTWLLWYDSVTTEGTLDWQNMLCPLNKPFFDACDGIFLNYVWTPAGLIESLNMAGDRKFDVYVGVDVWGRNCYQDGGFNLDKAMTVLRSLNMSVAIFAPGWTFETLPPGTQFLHVESAFWKKIWPYLYVRGPAKLPFTSNFCQGISFNKENGNPLFNLAMQQYQPTAQPCFSEDSCISVYLSDGVSHNGACLRIKAASGEHSRLFHRLFVCDFFGDKEEASSLLVTLLLKNSPSEPSKKFQMYFIVEDKLCIEGKRSASMRTTPKGYRTNVQVDGLTVVGSVVDFTAEKHADQIKIKGYKDTEDQPAYNSTWHRVQYQLELAAASSLTEILVLPPPTGAVLWGRILIERSPTVTV